MSFQDVREALICSYAAGCISDKAFLILYEEYESAKTLRKIGISYLACGI